MLAEERHALIQQELALSGKLTASEFADRVGVSGMTLRRDLAALERRRLLRRVHGGAIPFSEIVAGITGSDSAIATTAGGVLAPQRPAISFQVEAARSRSTLSTAATAPDGAPLRPYGRPRPSTTTPPAAPARTPQSAPLTIGMLVPTSQYYFSQVIQGAGKAAQAAGARLVLGVSGYDSDKELRLLRRFLASPIDAMLITPLGTDEEEPTEVLDLLHDAKVPVVMMERPLDMVLDPGPWDSVFTDHVRGTEQVVRRWAGRRGEPVALGILQDSPSTPAIEVGYRRAMGRVGFDPHVVWIPHAKHDPDAHRKALDELAALHTEQGVNAFLIHNDGCALELTAILNELGVSVPDDAEVIAYDDEIASLGMVPLSALAPPKYELGHRAATLSLQRIKDGHCARERVALAPRLVERESTCTSLN